MFLVVLFAIIITFLLSIFVLIGMVGLGIYKHSHVVMKLVKLNVNNQPPGNHKNKNQKKKAKPQTRKLWNASSSSSESDGEEKRSAINDRLRKNYRPWANDSDDDDQPVYYSSGLKKKKHL